MMLTYALIGVLVVFAALGAWRGWLREVATLAGLLVAWLILILVGDRVVGAANQLVLMLRFTLAGGFDRVSADPLLRQLRLRPAIDPAHPDLFLAVLFGVLAIGVYVGVNRLVAGPTAQVGRALGAMIGVANGYLIAFLLLRYLAPAARLRLPLALPVAGLANQLGSYLPTILVAGVLLAIVIALVSSGHLGARTGRRTAPTRARG
jgi:hypothetical protein